MTEKAAVSAPEKQHASLRAVNLLFLILMFLFIVVASPLQFWSFTWGLLLTELGVVLFPVLLFIFLLRLNWRETLNLQLPTWRAAALSYTAGVFIWPVASFLAGVSNIVLNLFGQIPNPVPEPNGIIERVAYFILFTVVAAFCEELLHRGVLLSTYERHLGGIRAVFYGGLIFGIFHMSLGSFASTALLGIIIGFIVYRTRSVWNGMLFHAGNNTVAAVLVVLVPSILSQDSAAIDFADPSTIATILIGLLFIGGVALISGSFSGTLIYLLVRPYPAPASEIASHKNRSPWRSLSWWAIIVAYLLIAVLEIVIRLEGANLGKQLV